MENPFILHGYEGPEYFCDRAEETHRLCDYLTNGNNVTLVAQRRIGKTGLIRHTFQQPEIKDHYNAFLIDIYATKSVEEMVRAMGRTILAELRPKGEQAIKKLFSYIRSLQPTMSFDQLGNPSWSIMPGPIQAPEYTLEEIFRYLEESERPCLVAIDEFQTVADYPEGNAEALLRTHVQHCRNTQFIFSGSQRSLMTEMFTKRGRPFFQSTTLMGITALELKKYQEFACGWFERKGKTLAPDVVAEVYRQYDGITWYLQCVMNRLFAMTGHGETCTTEWISEAIKRIVGDAAVGYEAMLYQIPPKQKELLYSICLEGKAQNLTSAKFIRKYNLPSASSVQSATKGLLEKQLISNENGTYEVYDRFFADWFVKR